MKAITLYQPYATAIAVGVKHFETRGFRTAHRGPIAIHASAKLPRHAHDFAMSEVTLRRIPKRLPLGAIVCIANLVTIRRADEVALEVNAIERLYGDYSAGRWAWQLADVRVLAEPIPVKGKQGIWEWPMASDAVLTFEEQR